MKARITFYLFTLSFIFIIQNVSLAQSGSLDLNFDSDGKALTPIGDFSNINKGNSLAIQSDGKIVFVGSNETYFSSNFTIVRYNTDGSLDNTFDFDGILTTSFATSFGNSHDYASSVVIQSDGKILVAGSTQDVGVTSSSNLAVSRYNTDGQLDNSFGDNGKVITSISEGYDYATSLLLQSDMKILVTGSTRNGSFFDFSAVRYNIDGSLDSTFDNDGIVITPFSLEDDLSLSSGIQNDGKILLTGYAKTGNYKSFATLRYNTDGSVDSTFGNGGKITTDFYGLDSRDQANSLAIQNDGKILVAGICKDGSINTNSITKIAIVRYDSNGTLDNSFGVNGKVVSAFGSYSSQSREIKIQSDGKILLVGFCSIDNSGDFVLARYQINGSLDNTFDDDGLVTTDFLEYSDRANTLAIQSDGKIVVGGTTSDPFSDRSDFVISRYNNYIPLGFFQFSSQNKDINIYPNPFSKETIISSKKVFINANFTLFNSFGQIVMEKQNINGEFTVLPRGNLSSGVYFIRMTQGNNIIANEKLIITD